MMLLEGIEIKNYRNIKHTKLDGLKDLNILVGPNNCGKTNILELIFSLTNLSCGAYNYLCQQCMKFKETHETVAGIYLPLKYEDFHLKKDPRKMEVAVAISFDREQIKKLVPGVLNKQYEKLELRPDKGIAPCQYIKDEILMENSKDGAYLLGKHFSPFIHKDIIEEIRKAIFYCPEGRLQSYKEKEFDEYIREKKFSGADFRRLIKFIRDLVDPAIHDHRYEDLIRRVGSEDFITPIKEQGSGVRSVICLVADLLSEKDAKILLIDEPELGLNPFAKQEFLKLLFELAKEKQIFVVTQDSTFVNPILWESEKTSVYFYSAIDEKFIKIDLSQNLEDPNTFAGYLPHTTTLKDIHIYVEGTSDVYIFQILLEKYLRETFEHWFEIINKVGIYHLCGDFWKHLLYTIPKHPYKCIVILDGDKREIAKEVCEKHNKSAVNASKFKVCESVKDIKILFGREVHPVYCLKEDCIERYLGFDITNLPQKYNKKKNGPKKADELEKIPEEIREILETIFKMLKT